MTDLILTWPKSRSLESYLLELKRAERDGLVINYRTPNPPKSNDGWGRCYMVHDGAVRGWTQIIEVRWRGEGEVRQVDDDFGGPGFWPEGWYVVREPVWRALDKPIPMQGFRGFRYAALRAAP